MRRITVVVPVYNRARMVREALASIAAQTRPPDEVFLVDDGSTDGSAGAARAFPGVRVFSLPHRGVSAARNAGIRAGTGDYFAFLDSDDLWEKDKLRLQECFMEAHPHLPLCHTEERWYRGGRRVNPRRIHRKEGGRIFLRSLERCLISPSAAMVRRTLFEEVGLFDEALPACEDYDLWLRITARHPVGFLEQPLTVKRGGHEDQLSRTIPALDRHRLRALEKILRQEDLPLPYAEAARDAYLHKAGIVLKGLLRRGRVEEAKELTLRIRKVRVFPER